MADAACRHGVIIAGHQRRDGVHRVVEGVVVRRSMWITHARGQTRARRKRGEDNGI